MSNPRNIYFNKQKEKYHVRVYRGGRFYHVGYYNTVEQAEKARDEFLKPDVVPDDISYDDLIKSPSAWKAVATKTLSKISNKYKKPIDIT